MLTIAVIGSALGLAGVPVWILGIVAVTLIAALVAFTVGRSRPFALPIPVLVCLVLAAYTYLQALPIPSGLLSRVAPANADIWSRALLPFREPGPRWASISLDPGASTVEALKWTVYGAVAFVAIVLGRRGYAPRLLAMIFASAWLIGLTTLAHGLAGATRVFGFYTPHFTPSPWHVGPLLNANNLAGYLNLGAFAGLGLLMSRRRPLPVWLVSLGEATIVGCELLTASRGGVATMTLGTMLLVALWGRPRPTRESNEPWRMRAVVAGSIGGGVLLAALAFQRDLWKQLYDKDLSKLRMVSWVKPMMIDHFWLGVGRGAFESVFPAYRTVPGNGVYTHIENFPAQWAVEWGLPVAVVALGIFGWSFRPRRMGVRQSSLASAAFTGVVVVLLQNLVDLGLELPALPIAVFTALGALWGDHERRRRPARGSERTSMPNQWAAPPRAVRAAAGVMGAAIVLALWAGSEDVATARDELHAELVGPGLSSLVARSAFRERLRGAMLRHPAEPFFPLLGAIAAIEGRDQDPLPWLSRSLERASVNGGAHFILAEVLARRGATDQALMELKLAVAANPDLTEMAARVALDTAKGLDELLRAVPEGLNGVPLLQAMAGAASPEMRRPLLLEAIHRDGGSRASRVLLASEDVRELHAKPPPDNCQGERRAACEQELEAQAHELQRLAPTQSIGDRFLADLLVLKGHPEDAQNLLATRCEQVEDRLACLSDRATIASQIAGAEPFASAARELAGAGCATAESCALLSSTLANLYMSRGESGSALSYFLRACRAYPSADCWLSVANTAAQTGAHAQAADAFEKAYRLGGQKDAALLGRAQSERAKAFGSSF